MTTLQVSDLRAKMLRATAGAPHADAGEPTTAALGTLLHRVFSSLIGEDDRLNINAALATADDSQSAWQESLRDHAYQQIVGPELLRQRAALQDSSRQVLHFWTACTELCRWLSELLWEIRQESSTRGVTGHENIEAAIRGSQRLWPHPLVGIVTEEPLVLTLNEPHWRAPVRISGVPDAVFYLRNRHQWCVVELKSGRTAPEADLLQACLYHRMLCGKENHQPPESGQLALVSFLPERRERLFAAQELRDAQARISDLAGRLAGVLPNTEAAASTVSPSSSAPRSRQTDKASPAGSSRRQHPPQTTLAVTQPANPEHRRLADRMLKAFLEYRAEVKLDGDPIAGPTFLRFPVALGHGVRLSAVRSRAAEVQLRLGLDRPPLINEHRGQVVIDVQRPDRQYVPFSAIRDQCAPRGSRPDAARVPVGVDLNGELEFADLSQTEHAHILVAGTTGSGKSEWLRTAIAGLIVSHTPESLQLVLIDPKRNAFHDLRESPYLQQPLVFPDEHDVVAVLSGLADEMDRRYRMFEGDNSLSDYVSRTGSVVPRIVCVCDEYFDLVNRNRRERDAIEAQIFRLGAKARAAGIHLIIATQQPSRQTIKGALDTNIPARIGLKLSSAIESRMLLGTAGAESLLNHGDLLFKDLGEPRRLQAAWIPPDEREAIFASPA